MTIIYTKEVPPVSYSKSLFLAGPSPRKSDDPNWRQEAIEILESIGYDGVAYIPLPRDGKWPDQYDDQVEWETRYLHIADLIVFWIPRDLERLPAFTTNVEFGMWLRSGKIVLGYPPEAPKMRYLAYHAREQQISVFDTLHSLLEFSVSALGVGVLRTAGEREVPLQIWNQPSFQQWYQAQKQIGNRLDHARVLWTFGNHRSFFSFALHVDLYIAKEDRHKVNEFVLARPDIASVVAYYPHTTFFDTPIVLVREFRSPARTSDGFIREIPGGSSKVETKDKRAIAMHEFEEETGLAIQEARFVSISEHQVCGTFSAHTAAVFILELTENEFEWLKKQEQQKIVNGITDDTERTTIEMFTLRELIDQQSNIVDWSTLGMIFTAMIKKQAMS